MKKKYKEPVFEIVEKEQISEIEIKDSEEVVNLLDTKVIDYVIDNIKK